MSWAVKAPGRVGWRRRARRSAWKSRAAMSRSGSQGSWKARMYQLRRSCRGLRRPLRKRMEWGRVEDHQSLDALGVVHGQQPGQPAAPVVPGDRGRAGAQGGDQVGHLLDQHPGSVVAHPGRLVGGVVAGQIGRDHSVAGVGERRELVSPGVPELGEAVQQHHQGAGARFDAVQAQPANVDPSVGHAPGAFHSAHPIAPVACHLCPQ
jgi:hypothetical protein